MAWLSTCPARTSWAVTVYGGAVHVVDCPGARCGAGACHGAEHGVVDGDVRGSTSPVLGSPRRCRRWCHLPRPDRRRPACLTRWMPGSATPAVLTSTTSSELTSTPPPPLARAVARLTIVPARTSWAVTVYGGAEHVVVSPGASVVTRQVTAEAGIGVGDREVGQGHVAGVGSPTNVVVTSSPPAPGRRMSACLSRSMAGLSGTDVSTPSTAVTSGPVGSSAPGRGRVVVHQARVHVGLGQRVVSRRTRHGTLGARVAVGHDTGRRSGHRRSHQVGYVARIGDEEHVVGGVPQGRPRCRPPSVTPPDCLSSVIAGVAVAGCRWSRWPYVRADRRRPSGGRVVVQPLPASTSAWVIVYVAVHVVRSPGARLVAGRDTVPTFGSSTLTGSRVMFPVLVDHEAVVDRRPAVGPVGTPACLSTLIDAPAAMRVSVESLADTSPPTGGVARGGRGVREVPSIHIDLGQRVRRGTGRRLTRSQGRGRTVHRPYGRVIHSHRIQRHVPGVGHHEAVGDRGARGVLRRRPGLLVQGDRRTGGMEVRSRSSRRSTSAPVGGRGRGGVREVPGIHIDLGQRVRRGTGRRLTRSRPGGRTVTADGPGHPRPPDPASRSRCWSPRSCSRSWNPRCSPSAPRPACPH